MDDFRTWFEKVYINWLSKRERRGSIKEFGELIGVDQRLVSNWMNGHKRPGPDYADRIAIFLNYDLTVYDLLDLPRPAKELLQLKALWPDMTEHDRADVAKLLDKIEKSHATQKRHPVPNT